jgi:hypothetical protein
VKHAVPLSRIWLTEKGLSAMLVFLALALFVGAPLMSTGVAGELVFSAFFSLLLLSGVATVAKKRLPTIGVSVLVLATLALRWTSILRPQSEVGIWSHALAIVSLGILTALVLMQVFKAGPVTAYRIQGAIVVYLLIGLMWTSAYEIVHRTLPGAFRLLGDLAPTPRITHGLAYYSFVTLTTVGYGDITPVHPIARSLAIAEALIGQLYPAILIARLVAMELEARRRS